MKDQERSSIVRTFSALAAGILLSAAIAVPAIHPQVAQAAAAHKPSPTPTPSPPPKNHNPFCSKLGKSLQASQGAQMFCFGAQSANAAQAGVNGSASASTSFGSNVDAANPQEDVTPSGVQVHGQSETSIASTGPYVVEAWNDGTGFFAPCGSPMSKDQLTGFGFSNDGGKTFTDLGGLPNANCATSIIAGDPSVEAFTVGGSTSTFVTE